MTDSKPFALGKFTDILPSHKSTRVFTLKHSKLTNFCAPFFKEIPSFFLWDAPSETLAAPKPPNIAFPLGNGGVLRSEEGEGFRKEGDGGEGEKEGKKDAQKVLRKSQEENPSEKKIHPK